MLEFTEEQISKIIKVSSDKNVKWAQARAYGTSGSVPAGWTVKKEPTQLARIAKHLIGENQALKLRIAELEKNQTTAI